MVAPILIEASRVVTQAGEDVTALLVHGDLVWASGSVQELLEIGGRPRWERPPT